LTHEKDVQECQNQEALSWLRSKGAWEESGFKAGEKKVPSLKFPGELGKESG